MELIIEKFFEGHYLWGAMVLCLSYILRRPIEKWCGIEEQKNRSKKHYSSVDLIILISVLIFLGYIIYYLLHSMKISTFSYDFVPGTSEEQILQVTDLAINRIYNVLTITAIFFTVLVVPLGLFQYFKIREIEKYKEDFDDIVNDINIVIEGKLRYFENAFNSDFYYSEGRYKEARNGLEIILKYNKENNIDSSESIYSKLAYCYYNIGLEEENIEFLSKASKIAGEKIRKGKNKILGLVSFAKAYIFDETTEFDKALKCFGNGKIDENIMIKKAYCHMQKAESSDNQDERKKLYKESLKLLDGINYEFKDDYIICRRDIEEQCKIGLACIFLENEEVSGDAWELYEYALNLSDAQDFEGILKRKIKMVEYILDVFWENGEDYLIGKLFVDYMDSTNVEVYIEKKGLNKEDARIYIDKYNY